MNRLQLAWARLRSSLWFVPALIVVGSVLLAVALIELDPLLDEDVLRQWPRLFGAGAEGTRGMLSAIAGAMITVAGVIFSVTIVALSQTSSQYSPRVLRNFMSDPTNQVVLGTFVGIYAYCLIVLRTIRGGDENPFVPSLATLGAVVLAFVGIALLIHFIHHISQSIQAAGILAAAYRATDRAIDRLYPELLGDNDDDDGVAEPEFRRGRWQPIASKRTGYIENVAPEALLQAARKFDILVRIPHCVGDFVVAGRPLVEVHAQRPLPDEACRRLSSAIAMGEQRTVEQDVAFGLEQIMDIALKALSPGVNDPTTAVMCVDYLSALLASLAGRRFPTRTRVEHDRVLLIVAAPSFAELLRRPLEPIRLAAAGNPQTLKALAHAIRRVAESTVSKRRLESVRAEAERLRRTIGKLEDPSSREDIASVIEAVVAGVHDADAFARRDARQPRNR